jgi:hypothetical protein
MSDVWRNARVYYTRTMYRITTRHGPILPYPPPYPHFGIATDEDIDVTPCRPATRDKLKRALLLRDQTDQYRDPLGDFVCREKPMIDPTHKELIEEVRKVLDAGPVEVR